MELIVPTLGESITEATVSKWLKKVGESFEADEPLVEIETDKITVEVPAPSAGSISEIKVEEGVDVNIGGVLALLVEKKDGKIAATPKEIIKEKPEQQAAKEDIKLEKQEDADKEKSNKQSPSVKKLIDENDLDADKIISSRSDGRLTKGDVFNFIKNPSPNHPASKERVEVVKMSKIRKTIATRLKESQNTAAILTTFNEVDMSEIMKVRQSKKEDFMERYNVKLGFMSFFVEKGLVVPVLKDADTMTFGDIEQKIVDLSTKAKEGSLTMDDLTGGTFTISNGGVYGSMLSTPIINRPQSGILGMHNIQKRAVVVDDEIVIRPMMYLAFSYDHRIIDGKESVGFLVNIKCLLENPSKLILGV